MTKSNSRRRVEPSKSAGGAADVSGLQPPVGTWMHVAGAIVLVAAITTVYWRACDSPFIFDDVGSVTTNPSITRLWPLWGAAPRHGPLNPPVDMPTSGRPLVNLSLALNYHFGQLDPFGYHVFNLIVHILSALLLMAIVERTLRLDFFRHRYDNMSGVLGFAVALVWALHPLQTETVVYVTQRTELLVGFFYFATVYGSLRYWTASLPTGRRGWMIVATVACCCGMACKEVMVTAPVVVLLLERTFVAGSVRKSLQNSWPLYVGLTASWLLLAWLNFHGPRAGSAGFHRGVPAYEWWLTQTKVLLLYLRLTFWPWPLAIHYEIPYLTSIGAALPWLILVALMMVGVLILLGRRSAAGFVGACVFLILSPTLVVPIVTEVAAERRMYLPLAALTALVVVGGYWLIERVGKSAARADQQRGVPFLAAIAVVAIALSVVSVRRLAAYQDELTLWEDNVAYQPEDYRALYNLANSLVHVGRANEAMEKFRRALTLNPNYAEAHYNLANALVRADKFEEAYQQYQQSLAANPEYAEAENNLGNMLLQTGRVDEAMPHFQRALQLKPDSTEIHNNLGNVFFQLNRPQEAMEQFVAAKRLSPDSPVVCVNLGLALARNNQPAEAIEQYEEAIRLKPDFFNAHYNLAMALVEANKLEAAIEQFQQALRLEPNNTQTRHNLGVAYFNAGRLQEAIEQFQKTLQVDPGRLQTLAKLTFAYAQVNQRAEAIATAEKALALARSQGDTAVAKQIEDWLAQYRKQGSGN